MPGIRISLIFLLILSGFACSSKKGQEKQAGNPLPIDSAQVQTREFSEEYSGLGQLQPVQETGLIALFEGNFELMHPSRKFYKAGELIYRLTGDAVDYQKTIYEEAVNTAKTEREYAESILNRKKELYSKHFVSPEQWAELEKNVRVAQIREQKADSAISYFLNQTNFRAPFPGYLTDVQLQQGAYLEANRFIGRFQNPDRIKIVGLLYESGSFLQSGRNLSLFLNDTARISAAVLYLESAIDPQTGGREVWFELPRLPANFLPGQWIRYRASDPSRTSPAIPSDALLMENHQYWVMVLTDHSPAARQIEIGVRQQGQVEVKSGLQSGEWVVTRGAYELFYTMSKIKYQAED
ncbi:MAG: efflux RND transporter periplasmic adaptor subunit [Calditrichia bacterium]